eukprot:9492440-Pyramimonas_sp.AAC.1
MGRLEPQVRGLHRAAWHGGPHDGGGQQARPTGNGPAGGPGESGQPEALAPADHVVRRQVAGCGQALEEEWPGGVAAAQDRV